MDNINLFTSLNDEQKINFFLKCQELLIKNHPNSNFIARKDNIKERVKYFNDICSNYKGYCYFNDELAILFNKINISEDSQDIDLINVLKENAYKEPKQVYNTVLVDFVIFNNIKNKMDFFIKNYDKNLKYIIFVKNAKPKLYKLEKFISSILNVKVV